MQEVVFAEYVAEGSVAPMMVRQSDYKYVECPADPPQLFNLVDDATEEKNIAESNPEQRRIFAELIAKRRDRATFDKAVRESQTWRLMVYPTLRNGKYYPWDFSTAAKNQRALYAQPHGFECFGRERKIPA